MQYTKLNLWYNYVIVFFLSMLLVLISIVVCGVYLYNQLDTFRRSLKRRLTYGKWNLLFVWVIYVCTFYKFFTYIYSDP